MQLLISFSQLPNEMSVWLNVSLSKCLSNNLKEVFKKQRKLEEASVTVM